MTSEQPLEELRLSWMADFSHYGYKCLQCNEEIKKTGGELLDDIHAEIRRDYTKHWINYRQEINKLTKGKDRRYKL